MIGFDWPWFMALLPLPLIFLFIAPKAQKKAALRMPFITRLPSNGQALQQASKNTRQPFALWLVWSLLLVAVSRPFWQGEPTTLPSSARDLMMAVDISGSMEVEDMQLNGLAVNRLVMVKDVVNDFVEGRKGDRLGLILFGSQAYMQSPLTFDLITLNSLLEEAQIGMAGKATAIGDAIGLAIKRLNTQDAQSRVLILLTDGANTSGEVSPIQAAQLAKQSDIKIYTIGVGADEMLQQSFFGYQKVNPSRDLDEKTLSEIANLTGGQYFRPRSHEDLEQIYTILDTLEPTEKEAETFRPKNSLFHWPLGIALILSFLMALIASMPALFTAKKGDFHE
jgi:Ca-activated chloride channel family protein